MTFYGPVPDPREFGERLPAHVRAALMTAFESRNGMTVSEVLHSTLAPYGLVDCRKPYLSAFGINVLSALPKGGNA